MDDVNCASHYKFFGPNLGVLYGQYALLDWLRAYKVRIGAVHYNTLGRSGAWGRCCEK